MSNASQRASVDVVSATPGTPHRRRSRTPVLSRSDEKRLTSAYRRAERTLRNVALESQIGAQVFLEVCATHGQGRTTPELVSLLDSAQSSQRVASAERRVRRLLDLSIGRSHRRMSASRAKRLRRTIETLGPTRELVSRILQSQQRVVAQISRLEPVTRQLELLSQLDRETLSERIAETEGNAALGESLVRRLGLPGTDPGLLVRTMREERVAVERLADKLGLDADSVVQSHQAAQAAARTRDATQQQMVRSNLGLVVKIAQRYARYGVPLPDLVQEGSVGLLKALERFNPERGFKFSTYAGWWIRHAIQRAIANTGRTIRLPVHRHELHRRMRRVAQELAQALERDPMVSEVADRVGVSPQTVEEVLGVSAEPRSLQEPLRGHDHALLGDAISGGQWAISEDSLAEQELSRRVVGLLDVLTPRERHVLKARFGLDDAHDRTLEEIGRGLGLSRERVRQIEVLAVEKLRSAALAKGLVK